jgi:hypothetical protein
MRTLADLRVYQPPGVDFIVKQPRCAALLRPGLGKTIVVLTARQRLGCRRTIVAGPAQVVESGVWSQEAAEWEHTRHLRVVELSGPPKERELDIILGGDIIVVSYDLLGWLTDRITDKKLVRNNYFDSVFYDELSKMKHPGTKRFKRMRAWAQDIPVRVGLTGSPLGNSWADIWGEMFITAGKDCLGDTQELFLDTYFKQVFHAGSKYPAWEVRRDGSVDEIKRRVKPYAFSIPKKLAATQLPEVVMEPLRLKMPMSCKVMENRLKEELEVELKLGHDPLRPVAVQAGPAHPAVRFRRRVHQRGADRVGRSPRREAARPARPRRGVAGRARPRLRLVPAFQRAHPPRLQGCGSIEGFG